MAWRARTPLKVFTRGTSLRRRVAYSLALVRVILVPVIFLAVYYLFAMGLIVDRIVRVDAPVATLAERASIDMLDARRAERNYFLLQDQGDVEANHRSMASLNRIVAQCRDLQPGEGPTIDSLQAQARLYQQRFDAAVARAGVATRTPDERLQEVVRAYQRDLNGLLKRAGRQSPAQTIADLRSSVGSFDVTIAATLEAQDPYFRQTSQELRQASDRIVSLANELENRSWEHVSRDHQQARLLIRRAEWVLGIVSGLTLLLSVWVSFILPRQAVKPLTDLKEAVDHALAGNYEIEFEVQGEGEVVQLANSVRKLIAHLRDRKTNRGDEAAS
jgi:methyl-accepting chemotaxis protein